ncbi:DUF1266 domain-containing protein [Methylobacterium indicum]|uniref:DUF1266 domain-containing protein n=1 Tax=Methylobacterium indicum TaxID=1775910 RepID=A0ABR5GWR1_9HYPH|nr:DUF1266 domain-containing protein [Methylobacterium indicum]KMO14363.1 hypothetical protein QR79_25840 [Methylobacterium indicum]KMO17275.1 hypothetical protein QR78_17780 [Methylobacterium indicum]
MSEPPFLYLDDAGYRSEPLRWAYALGACYNLYHEYPVDLPVDPETAGRRFRGQRDRAEGWLRRDWSIEDRAGLVAAMGWLGRDGHRRDHRALVRRYCALPGRGWHEREAMLAEHAREGNEAAQAQLWRMGAVGRDLLGCRAANFLAFDAARAAQLARNGYVLGFLSLDEVRAYLFDLAREVSASFASWPDYGRDFVVGRAFWAGAHEAEPWDPLMRRLDTEIDSPWRRILFGFPEDETSRGVTSADTRDGPCWTLETAPVAARADA